MTHRSTAAVLLAVLGLLALVRRARPLAIWKELVPTVGQRAARAKALARAVRAADPAGAEARLGSFLPAAPLARPHVGLLRGLARAVRPVGPADASELMSALASHAAWLAATGTPVTDVTVLDPDLVQRWALHGLAGLSAGTAANYRGRIARVAAANGGGPVRPAPLHASDPCEPYTAVQESSLVVWAQGLRTDAMRARLLAAVCLGLGAGLPTAELLDTRGTDVTGVVGGDGEAGWAQVRVRGARARSVPIRAGYVPTVVLLAEQAGPGPLLFPAAVRPLGKNALTNAVAAARAGFDPALPVLTAQRMRATWIVRHLSAGVRADVVLDAAGLDSLGSLDRYLRWVDPIARHDADALLSRSQA